MRSDDPAGGDIGAAEALQLAGSQAASRLIASGASFSGLERNRLFLNLRGAEFLDLSGLSGLDDHGDTRTTGVIVIRNGIAVQVNPGQ